MSIRILALAGLVAALPLAAQPFPMDQPMDFFAQDEKAEPRTAEAPFHLAPRGLLMLRGEHGSVIADSSSYTCLLGGHCLKVKRQEGSIQVEFNEYSYGMPEAQGGVWAAFNPMLTVVRTTQTCHLAIRELQDQLHDELTGSQNTAGGATGAIAVTLLHDLHGLVTACGLPLEEVALAAAAAPAPIEGAVAAPAPAAGPAAAAPAPVAEPTQQTLMVPMLRSASPAYPSSPSASSSGPGLWPGSGESPLRGKAVLSRSRTASPASPAMSPMLLPAATAASAWSGAAEAQVKPEQDGAAPAAAAGAGADAPAKKGRKVKGATVCEVCGRTGFSKPWFLRRHMLTHAAAKDKITYPCQFCTYESPYKNNTVRHEKTCKQQKLKN